MASKLSESKKVKQKTSEQEDKAARTKRCSFYPACLGLFSSKVSCGVLWQAGDLPSLTVLVKKLPAPQLRDN